MNLMDVGRRSRMRRIRYERIGGPETLFQEEVPVPEPGAA